MENVRARILAKPNKTVSGDGNDQTDDQQWVHRTALPDPFLLLHKFWSKFSSPPCDPFLTQDSEALESFLIFLILRMARAAGACRGPRTITQGNTAPATHSSTVARKPKPECTTCHCGSHFFPMQNMMPHTSLV